MSLIEIEPTAAAVPSRRRGMATAVRAALLGRPQAITGTIILAILAVAATIGPLLVSDPSDRASGPPFQAPDASHPLGTDDGGVDVLALVVAGARISIAVGLSAALIAVVIGGVVGVVAGYFGGGTEGVISRVVDYFLVLPALPLMIICATLFGQSLLIIVVIVGLLSWPVTARLAQAQAKSLRERLFVRRAQAIGAGPVSIIVRHVVPHLGSLLVANFVLAVGYAVFTETFISFVGLGDPNADSWGRTIQTAFAGGAMSNMAWWAFVPAGLCVAALVLGCTMIGHSIEDLMNPRSRAGHLGRRHRVRTEADSERAT